MINRISSLRAFREFSYSMTFDMDSLVCLTPCCDEPDCTGCSALLRNLELRSYHSECLNETLFPKTADPPVLLSYFFLICKNFAHCGDWGEPRRLFKRSRSHDDNRIYPDWYYSCVSIHHYSLYDKKPGA